MSFSTRLHFISLSSPRSFQHAVSILFDLRAARANLGSHGGLARAERASYFFGREPLEVAQHDSRPFLDRKRVKGFRYQRSLLRSDRVGLDVFAAREGLECSVLPLAFKRSKLMTGASLAGVVAAHVDDDS